MLSYIVIKSDDLLKIREYFKYSNITVLKDNKYFYNNHCMISLNEPKIDIIQCLSSNRIKARMIMPLISLRTFDFAYNGNGKDIIKQRGIRPLSYNYSEFENILASINSIVPTQNKKFVLMTSLVDDIDTNKEISNFFNFNDVLKNIGLLLEVRDFKVPLNSLFADSINDVLNEQSLLGSDIEQVKKNNEEFYEDVISTFILSALRYYRKEEIEEYLIELVK